MSVLNIRGVPEDLTNAVKIAAVKAGLPIREFVIKSLGDVVGVKPAKNVKPVLTKPKRAAATVAEQTVGSTTASKHAPRSGLARKARTEPPASKAPKGEFCKHKLRFCSVCPGFH